MANYLSQPYEANKPRTDENFQIWASVAQMRQQAYDTNKNKLQQTLDNFGGLDLLRDSDKEYVANKISALTNQINSSAQRDLSQGFVADDMLYTAKSLANDPILLNAVENTQKFRSFQSQVQKIQEKNPELYSDINYSYAVNQAGVDKYISGETDKIGNLQYSNYVDVTTTALKKVKELKDLRGKQVIETPDPQNPGQVIKRSIDGLTTQEILDYIPNILSPQERQQLNINGWSKYGGNLELAKNNFNQYNTAILKEIDENIENARATINNSAATSEAKKEAQAKLASFQRQREQEIAEASSININDAASIGGFLERRSWVEGIAVMGRGGQSIELEKDDYYFAVRDLELDLAQEARAAEKHTLDLANTQLDILKKQNELGLNPDGSANLGDVTYSAKESEILQEIKPFNEQIQQFNTVTNELVATINQAVNSERTTDDMRASYVSELSKRGYDINGNVIEGKEEIAKQYPKSQAMKLAFDAANIGSVHSQAAKQIAGAQIKRNALAAEVDKAKVDGLTEAFNENPTDYINSFRNSLKDVQTDTSVNTVTDFIQTRLGFGSTPDTNLLAARERAERFVNENGGWDKLQSALKTDKNKLKEFAEISDQLSNRGMPTTTWIGRFARGVVDPVYTGERVSRKNLKADASVISNQKMRDRVASDQSVSFTTGQVATIGTEALRKRVINMIPQTGQTALFDEKQPISYERLPNGNIRVFQQKGFSDNKSGGFIKQEATVEVSSNDAAFKELTRYTDLTDKQRGLDAARTNVKIKPTVPVRYLDGTNEAILSRMDKALVELSPSTLNAFTRTAHPTRFLTQDRTEEVYKAKLRNILPEEKIEQLVSVVGSNLNKLTAEMKNFDNNWALSVKTTAGKEINTGDTGIQYLEDDWVYLITNHPQVIVSDGLLRYIMKSPKQVDSLINTLQQQ